MCAFGSGRGPGGPGIGPCVGFPTQRRVSSSPSALPLSLLLVGLSLANIKKKTNKLVPYLGTKPKKITESKEEDSNYIRKWIPRMPCLEE